HNSFTRRDSALHHNLIVDGLANRHLTRFHGLVRFDDESELALLSGLNRLRWNHGGAVDGPQRHNHIYKLARPESVIGIRETSFQLDGAGSTIHRIVDEGELARRTHAAVSAIGNACTGDGERTLSAVAADFGKQLLGCAEGNV